jgi:hypothetical protein
MKKYEDIANKKIGDKYKYLDTQKDSFKDTGMYKQLEKFDSQMKKIYKDTNIVKKDTMDTESEKVEQKTSRDKIIIDNTKVNDKNNIEIADYEEIIIVDDEEQLQQLQQIEEEKKQKEEQKKQLFSTLKKQGEILDKSGVVKKEVEKIQEKYKELEKTQITLFYFASSDLDISNFNNFIAGIDKLKSQGYEIIGRVLFRGLIEDKLDGIPNWLLKNEQEHNLKRSPNVKYQFHTWAFKYFQLDKVPAFAISNCRSDFRFKTCEHKYLAKGNMSFQNFLEILKDFNTEYKNMLFDLVEVSK